MGFTNWGKTREEAAAEERRHANEMAAIRRETYEALREINTEMAESRRLHGEYRNWLYRTQAWHVSFEDWKAGRYVLVNVQHV